MCASGSLLAQNQMMNDGKHQNHVEFSGEAVEQRELFAISPSRGGGGTGDIGDECCDRFVLLAAVCHSASMAAASLSSATTSAPASAAIRE